MCQLKALLPKLWQQSNHELKEDMGCLTRLAAGCGGQAAQGRAQWCKKGALWGLWCKCFGTLMGTITDPHLAATMFCLGSVTALMHAHRLEVHAVPAWKPESQETGALPTPSQSALQRVQQSCSDAAPRTPMSNRSQPYWTTSTQHPDVCAENKCSADVCISSQINSAVFSSQLLKKRGLRSESIAWD